MKAVNPTGSSIPVYKFGGTSLETAERIAAAADLVANSAGTPVVVVSALARVTNALEALAAVPHGKERDAASRALEERHVLVGRALLGQGDAGSSLETAIGRRMERLAEELAAEDRATGEVGGRRDAVVAAGEDLSVLLVTAALRSRGLDARSVDAREVVRTDARFGRAIPDDEATVRLAHARLRPLVEAGAIPVMQGFVGGTADGRTTTLGRGGSDFTAAIVGAALGSREVTIWTDVDGIFTADPNQVPDARVLAELGFEEAVELAYFGARVVHPAAAKHAVGREVSLRIRNTFRPDAPGTLVRADRRGTPGVAALACKPNIALLTVRSRPLFMAYGFLARVFEVLTRRGVPVDLVATSHTSTAFTVDRDEPLTDVRSDLEAFAEVEVRTGLATISAIGAGLLDEPGGIGTIFRIVGKTPVRLISQATNTSLSFVVSEEEALDVVRRLHAAVLRPEGTPAEPNREEGR